MVKYKHNKKLSLPNCFLVILLLFLMAGTSDLQAEGTKQASPTSSDRSMIYLNNTTYNDFGRYDGTLDQRLLIRITDPSNEQILLGFGTPYSSGHYPCNGAEVTAYFRIKSPDGTVVYPTMNNPNGQLLDNTTANISSWAQATAGANQVIGSGGYDAYVFDPVGLAAGDYYVEFSRVSNAYSPNNFFALEHWDITVTTKAATPQAIDGRVYAHNWGFFTPSIACGADATFTWFDRPFNGAFFVYSDDGFVSKIDFDNAGYQPAAFNLFFNETGTSNTGDLIEDRKSIQGIGNQESLHRIFLNNPDVNAFPSGNFGTVNGEPQFSSCREEEACFILEVTAPGQINVIIDLNQASGPFLYDPGTEDVVLAILVEPEEGEQIPYTRCVPWDGKDGLGNQLSLENSYDALVTYTQGTYHLPIFDAEYMLNGFTTTTIRPVPPEGSPDKLYYDDRNIPFAPGNGEPKIEINGCQPPCHTWTDRDYGDNNTINTWFYAREEIQIEDEAPLCLIDAINDSIIAPFETPTDILALVNDIGDLIDTGSISLEIIPNNGVVTTIDSINGSFTYTPDMGFTGLDTFQYLICYDVLPRKSMCDPAFVYINVPPPTETNCSDLQDNDMDGLIDCDDPDCLPSSPLTIYRKNE